MATFGATTPSETYAADSIRAIDAMLDETKSWNGERQGQGQRSVIINWAVATGPVVFGAVGDENRLEFTVIGEAANLAAKLEKHNKAESSRALATAETYTLARGQGYSRPTRPEIKSRCTVVGVDEAIDLAVLA